MNARAEVGQYKSLQAIRSDYELMCFNALQFNREGSCVVMLSYIVVKCEQTCTGDFYWKQAENMYKKGKSYFRELAKGTQTSPYGLEAEQVISAYSRSARLKERESEYAKSNLAGPAERKVMLNE